MSFDHYISTESLTERFYSKIQKSQALGSDGIAPKQFEDSLDSEIALIQRKINNMSYSFSRFSEKLILKNKSSPPRAVYIPTVRDRLVLNALNSYLAVEFADDLKPYQLTVKANVSEIIKTLKSEQFDAFIKLDVKNFFPSLDHKILLTKLHARIKNKAALSLFKKVLNRSKEGVAQGLSISNQLAAIYLNEMDKSFKHRSGFKYFRFVDDILILCNHSDVDAIRLEIQKKMDDLNLDLHAVEVGGKSEYGVLGKDTLEYLGFSFLGDNISVRESSVENLRKRIRQLFIDTCKNSKKNSGPDAAYKQKYLYKKINLKISGCLYDNKKYGWLFFFQDINDLTLLHHLDWFVKKCFSDFEMNYDHSKIKSFVKTYFKIKSLNSDKLDAESYIPKFAEKKIKTVPGSLDYLSSLARTEGDAKPIKDTKNIKNTEYYDIQEFDVLVLDLVRDVEIY